MKRWFSLALVALFLVPVLAVGVSASEIYEFEYFEPISLYDDQFKFLMNQENFNIFVCYSVLSDGIYRLNITDDVYSGTFDSVTIQFVYDPEYSPAFGDALISFSELRFSGSDQSFPVAFLSDGSVTMFASPFSSQNARVTVERLSDLPSESGFDTLLGDVSSFTGSCFSFITKVADTITGSPLLLLTVGILFIGGCIGITGRLFSRR